MTGKYFIEEENSRKFAISRKERRMAETLQLRNVGDIVVFLGLKVFL